MSVTDREEVTGPRAAPPLLGQEDAVQTLLAAMASGRMPHAWLFTGPKGIGKASLAYRLGYAILAGRMQPAEDDLFGDSPSSDLDLDLKSPVIRRAIAGGHADFMVLERQLNDRGVLRNEIVIDDVRKLQHFFAMTPAEGGWRVAIVDSADDLNVNAANALLKLLEEPPAQAILILISHAPGNLLPTIVSRCRRLSIRPVADDVVRDLLMSWDPALPAERADLLVRLVNGSPGRAEQLLEGEALDFFDSCLAMLNELPRIDMPKLHALADKLNRRGKEEASEIALDGLSSWVQRGIRAAATAKDASELPAEFQFLGPAMSQPAMLEQWIEVWENMRNLRIRSRALNLDRKQMVVQIFQWMADCGRRAA